MITALYKCFTHLRGRISVQPQRRNFADSEANIILYFRATFKVDIENVLRPSALLQILVLHFARVGCLHLLMNCSFSEFCLVRQLALVLLGALDPGRF